MRRYLLVIIVLIVLVGGVAVWFTQLKTYEFGGAVLSIEGSTIFASGYFLENGLPVDGSEAQPVDVEISVGSDTTLTRLAIQIPEGEEMFYIDDLEQEETPTDLDTVKADTRRRIIGIDAVLKKNIFGKNFKADSLYFRVPVTPALEDMPIEGEPPATYD